MKLGTRGAAIDKLDQYLAARDYEKALQAITAELHRNPDQLNLRLRQAEIVDLNGDRKRAIYIYHSVAERQALDGFYARAIAIYKKILRLDPDQEVHSELARLIEEDRQSKVADERRRKAEISRGQKIAAETQELKELQASELFASFEREALVEILSSTELRTFEEGDIIVTEGETGSSLFMIVTGSVKVFTRTETGANLALAELGPGDFFGEVSLLTGKPRTATITSSTEVAAIELAKEDVDRVAKKHPEVHGVLKDFYESRARSTAEAVISSLRNNGEATQA